MDALEQVALKHFRRELSLKDCQFGCRINCRACPVKSYYAVPMPRIPNLVAGGLKGCVTARNNNCSLPLERSSCGDDRINTTTGLQTCALPSFTLKSYNLSPKHLQCGAHFPSAIQHIHIYLRHITHCNNFHERHSHI